MEIRIIGSVLVALSGLILFSEKIFHFELENNFGFKSTGAFIWVLSQTLSPMLMLLGSLCKPYKTSYLVPVYIYTIQLYWVFNPNIKFDDYFLQAYAIGACLGYLLLAFIIYKINLTKKKQELERIRFQVETNKTIELLKREILSTSK